MKTDVWMLMGLPGSGKTTFAENTYAENKMKYGVIHVDDVMEMYKQELANGNVHILYEARRKMQDKILRAMCRTQDVLIVDGLMLTNDDLLAMMQVIVECFDECRFIIHRWNADRETCLRNDGERRHENSEITIRHALYEEVNLERLNREMKKYDAEVFQVVSHTVFLKPDWVRCFRNYTKVNKDGKLYSASWCTGGNAGSCCGDFSIISLEEPCEFSEFDELLEELCPNLTFLHYKKLKKECVEIESERETDYYGGSVTNQRWVCDLERLYQMLDDFGYVWRDDF